MFTILKAEIFASVRRSGVFVINKARRFVILHCGFQICLHEHFPRCLLSLVVCNTPLYA